MSTGLAKRAASLLDCIKIDTTLPTRFGRVVHSESGIARARGIDLPVGSGARVATASGGWNPAIVVGFGDWGLSLLPLVGGVPVAVGAAVGADAAATAFDVGIRLLGRVIDALGQPLDGRGPVFASARRHAGVVSIPLHKARIREAMETGVRAIDALVTLGVGQRVAIIAGSGMGKSTLLGQIMRGIEADVIVVALVGERACDISDFVEGHVAPETRARTIIVASAADAPPVLRLRAVERATMVAEYFRDAGKRVVLIVDSLTRVAHAQREVALALGEPPTENGYPPSALSIIPRVIERGVGDLRSGGSITALYTILADGDDLDDAVADMARSITDGHIVLSRTLAEMGVFPAIDIARSLSRTMNDVVSVAQQQAANQVRRDWSLAEENREPVLIGAARAGADSDLDRALAARPAILDFIRQAPDRSISARESVAALIEMAER